MAADKKLTKKQQKALAFRSGTKGKQPTTAPAALPDASDDEAEVQEEARPAKRKRGDGGVAQAKGKAKDAGETREGDEEEGEEGKEDFTLGAAAKRRRRKKASQARAAASTAADGEAADGKAKKSRLIVFVGNLPFDVSAEQVAEFFSQCGERPQVRLLTTKAGQSASKGARHQQNGKKGGDSKGCAFVEFVESSALQNALRLHHSPFPGPSTSTTTSDEAPQKPIKSRKINVELSAGGGGHSQIRQEKLAKAKERLEKQRGKRAEKEVREEAVKKALGQEEEGEKEGKKEEGKNRKRKRGNEGQAVAPKEKKVRKMTSGANAMPLG